MFPAKVGGNNKYVLHILESGDSKPHPSLDVPALIELGLDRKVLQQLTHVPSQGRL